MNKRDKQNKILEWLQKKQKWLLKRLTLKI